jgi:hypothetical protein
MERYRVCFFKNLITSYGKPFDVCQRSIVIHSARNQERAIKAAQVRFARLEHIGDWTLRADRVETEVVPNEVADAAAAAKSRGSRVGNRKPA